MNINELLTFCRVLNSVEPNEETLQLSGGHLLGFYYSDCVFLLGIEC